MSNPPASSRKHKVSHTLGGILEPFLQIRGGGHRSAFVLSPSSRKLPGGSEIRPRGCTILRVTRYAVSYTSVIDETFGSLHRTVGGRERDNIVRLSAPSPSSLTIPLFIAALAGHRWQASRGQLRGPYDTIRGKLRSSQSRCSVLATGSPPCGSASLCWATRALPFVRRHFPRVGRPRCHNDENRSLGCGHVYKSENHYSSTCPACTQLKYIRYYL